MNDVRNILLDLVAALVFFLLGMLSRQLSIRWQGRTIGRFWRPLVRNGVTLVIGRLDKREFLAYEPSGVVGVGDVHALVELSDILRRAGLKRFAIAFGDALTDEQRKGNLVLFGGSDGSQLSADLMKEVGSRIELMNEDRTNPPVLLDNIHAPAGRYPPTLAGDKVLQDFGVLVRARNPQDRRSWVVIIAGCLGYGTWAGVQLTQRAELVHAPEQFEYVYRVQCDAGHPMKLTSITGVRHLGN